MTNSPEAEKRTQPNAPEGVHEIPEVPEIPVHVERGGVVTHQSQFTATIQDDNGNDLVHSPASKAVTIRLPASQKQLMAWSEGSPDDSLTGFALFWLRLIKKALHFGWKAIMSSDKGN